VECGGGGGGPVYEQRGADAGRKENMPPDSPSSPPLSSSLGKFVSIFVVGFVTCVFLCVKKMEIQPGRVEQLFLRQYLFAGVCCPAIFSFS
jgi:hypothetical protein